MTMPAKIVELWAWVREDEGDGEGILASEMVLDGRRMMVPLIGADRARIESYRDLAYGIAASTGHKIKLMRFSNSEVIE
jgi:hypothetical protein